MMSEIALFRVRAIAKKEIVEFVRDWRTIMAIIIIPLLMFPLLFILFPILLESEAAELDALELTIVVQSNDLNQSLEQAIIGADIPHESGLSGTLAMFQIYPSALDPDRARCVYEGGRRLVRSGRLALPADTACLDLWSICTLKKSRTAKAKCSDPITPIKCLASFAPAPGASTHDAGSPL